MFTEGRASWSVTQKHQSISNFFVYFILAKLHSLLVYKHFYKHYFSRTFLYVLVTKDFSNDIYILYRVRSKTKQLHVYDIIIFLVTCFVYHVSNFFFVSTPGRQM